MTAVSLDGWTERLDANLTWQGSTLLAEKMSFWAVAGLAEGDVFEARAPVTEPAVGVSPIRITAQPAIERDEDILFIVEPFCEDPGPVCAYAAFQQELRVDGTVWTREASGE